MSDSDPSTSIVREIQFDKGQGCFVGRNAQGSEIERFQLGYTEIDITLSDLKALTTWFPSLFGELVPPDELEDAVEEAWYTGVQMEPVEFVFVMAHAIPKEPVRWATRGPNMEVSGMWAVEPLEYFQVGFHPQRFEDFEGASPSNYGVWDERAKRGGNALTGPPEVTIELELPWETFGSFQERVYKQQIHEALVRIAVTALCPESEDGQPIIGDLPSEREPICIFGTFAS